MNSSDSQQGHADTSERRTILDAIPAIAWCKLPDGSNEADSVKPVPSERSSAGGPEVSAGPVPVRPAVASAGYIVEPHS